jgi:SAM-dependent methyltransferase
VTTDRLHIDSPHILAEWVTALEARHLSNLRVPEVTKALRALSSAYVQRRGDAVPRVMESAGKRAAFALFYSPLHFLATSLAVRALEADVPPPRAILDIGCGTGAAGAAWAIAAGSTPTITGIDRHPWAVEEARWAYRQLKLAGQARRGDVARLPPLGPGTAVVAAYVLNELPDEEPIARRISPWWNQTASRIEAAGGRADEWRFDVDLPPLVRLLDKAAGLNHRELTLRSLYSAGTGH